jgi:hypothetical protein
MSPTSTRRKAAEPNAVADQRIQVLKTYKLYIGGAFPRSESGRTYEIHAAGSSSGRFLANAAMGSRKDARDAVVAARGALGKWATADGRSPRAVRCGGRGGRGAHARSR